MTKPIRFNLYQQVGRGAILSQTKSQTFPLSPQMSHPPSHTGLMKPLLRFLRSLCGRLGLLAAPEPEQLDFFARLEPVEARVKASRLKNRRS
jgi:hypothetical protein